MLQMPTLPWDKRDDFVRDRVDWAQNFTFVGLCVYNVCVYPVP